MKYWDVYLFEINDRDECKITYEASIYPSAFSLRKIIGKRTFKNKKTVFEEIELFDGTRCLIKRKCLTEHIVRSFITGNEHGIRSVQHYPYTDDLLDTSLLDELNIEVLTYKHYYSGDKKIRDIYLPIKKDDPDKNKIIEWTKEQSIEAIEEEKYINEHRLPKITEKNIDWKSMKNQRI